MLALFVLPLDEACAYKDSALASLHQYRSAVEALERIAANAPSKTLRTKVKDWQEKRSVADAAIEVLTNDRSAIWLVVGSVLALHSKEDYAYWLNAPVTQSTLQGGFDEVAANPWLAFLTAVVPLLLMSRFRFTSYDGKTLRTIEYEGPSRATFESGVETVARKVLAEQRALQLPK